MTFNTDKEESIYWNNAYENTLEELKKNKIAKERYKFDNIVLKNEIRELKLLLYAKVNKKIDRICDKK